MAGRLSFVPGSREQYIGDVSFGFNLNDNPPPGS